MHSPYIDFHTHASNIKAYANRTDVIGVQSLMYGIDTPCDGARYVTVGVHPMQHDASKLLSRLAAVPDALIEEMIAHLSSIGSRLCGIGECGWDSRSPLSWEEQDRLMELHLFIAEQLSLPLVVHNVGGLHRLLALKAKHSSGHETPWIVHGFRGKVASARQLIDAGILLSLSPSEHTPQELLSDSILPHIFFETDERPSDIAQVYFRASELSGLDIMTLRKQMYDKFIRIVGDNHHVN